MDIQRLRNLTTGRLHTRMEDIYQDLEYLSGMEAIMTHMIPNVMRSIEPWLREQVTDSRFWDGQFDQTHVGECEICPMCNDEQADLLKRYGSLPNPLAGKHVVAVMVVKNNTHDAERGPGTD